MEGCEAGSLSEANVHSDYCSSPTVALVDILLVVEATEELARMPGLRPSALRLMGAVAVGLIEMSTLFVVV